MVLHQVLHWVNSTVASGSCVKLNAMGIWKMNKRIEELIRECEDFGDWETVRYTFDKEKFAELIVRECAEVADNADATRQKWEGIGKYVREHFGVEE